MPRRLDAKVQGGGSVHTRRSLESSSPLRADPRSRSHAVSRGRKGDGDQGRGEAAKAQRSDQQEWKEQQIGGRQRVSPPGGEAREPQSEPRQGRRGTPSPRPRKGRFREESQGEVRRPESKARSRRRRDSKERSARHPASPSRGGREDRSGEEREDRGTRERHLARPERDSRRRGRQSDRPERQGKRQTPLEGEERKRKALDKEPTEGGREVRLKKEPSSGSFPQPSAESTELEEQVSGLLRSWLREHEYSGLSAAQLASHLALQIWHSPSPLQRLMEWNLQAPEHREERVRNLFPLPLWHDDVEQLKMVLTAGEYKDRAGQWRERGDTRSKAQKALRLEGLKTWHALAVLGLNFLYGDREKSRPPWPGSQATVAQEKALGRIWEMVKVFFDDKERVGVPRTPLHEWEHEIGEMNVTYTGEVVEKAQWVTLRQILPGLPSPEHVGLVDILELVPPDMAETLRHPERLIRESWPEAMPKPRVMCEDSEWDLVAEALYQRGLIKPVDQFVVVENEHVLNGVFGVPKAEKKLASEEAVFAAHRRPQGVELAASPIRRRHTDAYGSLQLPASGGR